MFGGSRAATVFACAIVLAAAFWTFAAPVSKAAELQLRNECQAAGGLIKLGDLAQVRTDDHGHASSSRVSGSRT